MCSQYEIRPPQQDIIERFGLTHLTGELLGTPANSIVRPTDSALIIGADQIADLLPWGLKVDWQKSPVINARAETALEKPTFRPLLDRRVIVPASAYFEWRQDGTEKIKTRIAPEGSSLFVMAGLRSNDRFVILTCSPAEPISNIHSRMPVILDAAHAKEWLNPDYSFEDLAPLLQPYAGDFTTEETPRAKPAQTDLFH